MEDANRGNEFENAQCVHIDNAGFIIIETMTDNDKVGILRSTTACHISTVVI